MDIISKITRNSLKLNKKRTVSTIIGIMLSVALICAVATMVRSAFATITNEIREQNGNWHYRVLEKNADEFLDKLKSNRNVKYYYKVEHMGMAKLEGSKNPDKYAVNLDSMSKNSFLNLRFKIVDGRFPENENEIIISEHIINNGGVQYKIGDTVNFSFYKNQNQAEKLDNRKFKIVGIMERPGFEYETFDSPSYTIITTGIEKEITPQNEDVYIVLKNGKKYKDFGYDTLGMKGFDDNIQEQNIKVNETLLGFENKDFSQNISKALYILAAFVMIIIVVSSVFCIRNSFAIATTEKMRQYGLLTSLGATKKQIKKSVMYEAVRLGLIGIPLGVGLGLAADYVVIKVVNNILKGVSLKNPQRIFYSVSPLAIIVSVILGALTIWLSARNSANRAAKISPIESIRNVQNFDPNSAKMKASPLIRKIFGIGGEIAYRNLRLSRKKYRTTVISIVVSIVIFVMMTSFIHNMFQWEQISYKDYDYNIKIADENLENEDVINQILSLKKHGNYGIEYQIDGKKDSDYRISEDDDQVAKYGSEGLLPLLNIQVEGTDNYNAKYINLFQGGYQNPTTHIGVIAYDDKTFKKLAEENELDYDKIKDKGILYDTIQLKEDNKTILVRTYSFNPGDKLKANIGNEEENFVIGGIAKKKNDPLGYERIYNNEGYLVIDKEHNKDLVYNTSALYVDSKDPNGLEKVLVQSDNPELIKGEQSILNISQEVRDIKAFILIIKIFAYGFITVITLIGLTNIFNTITSNVELRQREFAILKSVGMTGKEFNKMINLETMFYSMKALIIGISISLVGDYGIRHLIRRDINGIQSHYPVVPIIICIVAVFVLVFVIMRYAINKINKKNIIDTIRQENI